MKRNIIPKSVVKATYFANWGDIFGFPLAAFLLPYVAKIPLITPNIVTISSFLLYLLGSISLFAAYPHHLLVSAFALPLGFLCDDMDGQLARYKKMSSTIGDYLDKVLDVLKIFLVTSSLALAAYLSTHQALYIFLGFIACFFFNYRYYIKLETMFSRINADPTYLETSNTLREKLVNDLDKLYGKLEKTFGGKLKRLWLRNRIIFFVDEAEFALFTAVGALFHRLDLVLWTLAISQVCIAFWRFGERAYQLTKNPQQLLKPMRK